uniref:Uncharacterized protein n=1 Tax=Strongyloides papillosus TaxID=174720 RepID=A0A0N5BTI7_STREA
MDITIVKVIVKPSVSIISENDANLSQLAIEKYVALDSRIFVKDLCRKIMEKIGLQDLVNQSHAFIQHSNLEYYPLNSFIPDMNVDIGSISPLLKNKLTVKLLVPLKSDDFVKMEEVNILCRNLLQYLFLKIPEIGNHIPDVIYQYIKDEGRNCHSIRQFPLETLIQMNEENIGSINRSNTFTSNAGQNSSLFSTPRMYSNSFDCKTRYHGVMFSEMGNSLGNLQEFSGGNSYPGLFQVNHDRLSSGNRPDANRSIIYNKDVELPILQQWYKSLGGSPPTNSDLQNHAFALNILSSRSDPNKLTADDILDWYKKRQACEGRQMDKKEEQFII